MKEVIKRHTVSDFCAFAWKVTIFVTKNPEILLFPFSEHDS